MRKRTGLKRLAMVWIAGSKRERDTGTMNDIRCALRARGGCIYRVLGGEETKGEAAMSLWRLINRSLHVASHLYCVWTLNL